VSAPPSRPTREQLQGAYGAVVPDLVAPGLRVLLVGINPSLWSGVTGYHFARPGNRLWRTLATSGLTPRLLAPHETGELLAAGVGISNLVPRATARADELTDDELRAGPARVEALAARWEPRAVAVLGISAYRTGWGRKDARVGRQDVRVADRPLWVLPNPSGLNASYQQPALTAAFAELAAAVPPLPPV
jgi:TDG/mug DNA glycosylase family protein